MGQTSVDGPASVDENTSNKCMKEEPGIRARANRGGASMATQPHDWQDLTPLDLLRFARRWTIKSWLFVLGLLVAVAGGSWSAGYGYRAGILPEFVYVLEDSSSSPLAERRSREDAARFEQHYDDLMNWQTLRAIASSIAKDSPDGLTSDFEIVGSLLAQLRGTRGEAH